MQLKDQDPRRFGVRTCRDADGNLKSVDVDASADEIRKALTIRFDAIHKVEDYLSSGLSSAQSSLTKEDFDGFVPRSGFLLLKRMRLLFGSRLRSRTFGPEPSGLPLWMHSGMARAEWWAMWSRSANWYAK